MLVRVKTRSTGLVLIYLVLIVSSVSFLLASRTKIGPYVYSNLHPWFMPAFLVTVLFLGGLIMSKGGSPQKLWFVVILSVLSCSFLVVVLDAGYGWDTWVHLGMTRQVYDNVLYDAYGNPWRFHFSFSPSLRRVLGTIYRSAEHALEYSLSVTLARMFYVDVYWVHLLLVPLLWGIFTPIISYTTAKALCKEERAALISAFLVTSFVSLIAWGASTVPQSLGYIFFSFTIYSLLGHLSHNKNVLLAIICAFTSFLAHYITGMLSFSFILLSLAFKKYHDMKHRRIASIQLIATFALCCSILPLLYYFQRYFYPIECDFTLSKLLNLSPYDAFYSLIFTKYGGTVKNFITQGGLVEFLGFLGLLIYGVLKREGADKRLCGFLLLAYLILEIDLRIITKFMIGVTTLRIGPCMSLITIPLAGILINSLATSLSPLEKFYSSTLRKAKSSFSMLGARKAMVMTMFTFSLFGMVASSVYKAYVGKGGYDFISGYELEAAKYIDETTPGSYVVICDDTFKLAGYALVGIRNPRAFYSYVYDFPAVLGLFRRMCRGPSPELMMEAASLNNASYAYFVVSTRSRLPSGVSLASVVDGASMYFERYLVFGDEENILGYVFRYEMPPYLLGSDVLAFYWDEPPSHVIQNDLMRVFIPENRTSLEVRDLQWRLLEGINFIKTLVDGDPLGDASKVEYFEPSDEIWINWNTTGDVCLGFAMKQQFKFRLLFPKVALVAVVERGKPLTQLHWESLDGVSHNITCDLMTEGYERFLIPGLSEIPASVHSSKYGAYYTVSHTEGVSLHYAHKYDTYGKEIYPYQFKDYCKFRVTSGYLWYEVYVDNDADFGRWVYVEMYLPNSISGGSAPPFSYSTDHGNTWNSVYTMGPAKTINGTEVNWVVSGARQWSKKPSLWLSHLGAIGGKYNLPDTFTNSGGCWNRIIFGIYLLGDTNPGSETSSGNEEGDQALVRIGVSRYGSPLDATYIFRDSEEAISGLRNMNDVFLTFYTGNKSEGGVTFTEKVRSLNITANKDDKIEDVSFEVQCNATFSLLAQLSEYTAYEAYESLARLSYKVSESDDRVSLTADVTSVNDWGRLAEVTICIPSDYDHEGGALIFDRGFSRVLRVEVTDGTTETITIYPKE